MCWSSYYLRNAVNLSKTHAFKWAFNYLRFPTASTAPSTLLNCVCVRGYSWLVFLRQDKLWNIMAIRVYECLKPNCFSHCFWEELVVWIWGSWFILCIGQAKNISNNCMGLKPNKVNPWLPLLFVEQKCNMNEKNQVHIALHITLQMVCKGSGWVILHETR